MDVNGAELDNWIINPKQYVNRSIVLYGASDSGKSTIIKDLVYHLRDMATQIFVFAPSDPSNGDYTESGTIPKPLVHYILDATTLTNIWKRQEAFAAVYERVNDIHTLESLFKKLNLETVSRMLLAAERSMDERKEEVKDQYLDKSMGTKKIKEIEKTFDDMRRLIYKRYIVDNRHKLARFPLTEEENFTLRFITFNLRLVIIFDDCATEFKKLRKEKCNVLDTLLYRGRHIYVTTFIACQDDKNLDSDLRKNTFINVYTTPQCAMAFFNRAANSFDKETMRRADRATKEAFAVDNQKLIYVRKENKFYKFTATIRDSFEFGSPAIREFCKRIQNDGVNVAADNMFIKYFQPSRSGRSKIAL